MKTLFLLRHAKSENLTPGLSDLDRKLNESGRKQAQTLGSFLKQQNLRPDLVLCSTAARARETTEIVLGSAELAPRVDYDQAIYESGPTVLLQLISKIDNSANTALMVGHNPGMEEFVRLLTEGEEHMSTCTLAEINFDIDEWNKVLAGKGTLVQIVRPMRT